MDNNEENRQFGPELELLIQQLARNRANASKWDINILVVLFAVLITEMILIALDIDMRIVAITAVVGLASVLFLGSMKGKRLTKRFYAEEVEYLQQESNNESTQLGKQLTTREREILTLVSQGYSNKMIGAKLGISINTVKIMISRILTKLEANDRTEAVVIAIKQKIISIG
ncbi:response regulator transcription factor [Chloroflexota bacterium]